MHPRSPSHATAGGRGRDNPRSRRPRRGQELVGALVVGILFGLVDRLGRSVTPVPLPVTEFVGPWIVLAFAARAVGPRHRSGALRGVLALGGALTGYYLAMLAIEHRGGVGGIWRRRSGPMRAVAASLPTGVLAGEALTPLAKTPALQWAVLSLWLTEIGVAALLPLVLLRGVRLRLSCYAWPRSSPGCSTPSRPWCTARSGCSDGRPCAQPASRSSMPRVSPGRAETERTPRSTPGMNDTRSWVS